jgi:hypothetical protein
VVAWLGEIVEDSFLFQPNYLNAKRRRRFRRIKKICSPQNVSLMAVMHLCNALLMRTTAHDAGVWMIMVEKYLEVVFRVERNLTVRKVGSLYYQLSVPM